MLTIELTPSLQKLIDSRLDNIERTLMFTRVSRSERRQIVGGVEEQIFEMLGRLNQEEVTRVDVLSVLASLDPPEAYEHAAGVEMDDYEQPSIKTGRATKDTALIKPLSSLAMASVTLSSFAAVASLLWWVIGYFGLLVVFGLSATACVLGILAICETAGRRPQRRGLPFAILGASSPVISSLICLVAFGIVISME